MTPLGLTQARNRLGMTQAGLAARLQIGTRTLQRYEAGTDKVPEVVALAVRALEHSANVKTSENIAPKLLKGNDRA